MILFFLLHNFSTLSCVKWWLFFRFTKQILFINMEFIILSFLIWHLYYSNFNQAFRDIRRAFFTLTSFLIAYSLFELLWLKFGSSVGFSFLVTVNPLLYDPGSAHGWWPPLLWRNQLRSMFPEPSFFGIFSAMVIPFLWSYLFEHKHKGRYIFMIFFYTVMIAATNARTAIALFGMELLLLVLSMFTVKSKKYGKTVLLIVTISAMAFTFNFINIPGNLKNNADLYFDRTIGSLGSTQRYSNNARLSYLEADFKTAVEHSVFGVGTGLKDAYIDANLPTFSFSNQEVMKWKYYMHTKGVLKSGYPGTNKYVDLMAESGVIGLLLYLLSFGYTLKELYNFRHYAFMDYRIILTMISMIALLGAGFSSITFSNCIGFTLGLLICAVYKFKKNTRLSLSNVVSSKNEECMKLNKNNHNGEY